MMVWSGPPPPTGAWEGDIKLYNGSYLGELKLQYLGELKLLPEGLLQASRHAHSLGMAAPECTG